MDATADDTHVHKWIRTEPIITSEYFKCFNCDCGAWKLVIDGWEYVTEINGNTISQTVTRAEFD